MKNCDHLVLDETRKCLGCGRAVSREEDDAFEALLLRNCAVAESHRRNYAARTGKEAFFEACCRARLSPEEAELAREEVRRRWPGVASWLNKVKDEFVARLTRKDRP